MANVYDQLFDLSYYANFDWKTCYNWPVRLRRYYYTRLKEKKDEEEEAAKGKNSKKL